MTGTWMTHTASLWLVYHLSGSPFLLGLVGFSRQIPILILGPFAGVWIDQMDRWRLIIVTQFLSMLQSFALAALALTHRITPTEIIILNFIQGLINAFDNPSRQSMLVQFVGKKENLTNAIALNSSMINLAKFGGPALGGLIIDRFGAGACYLIDGTSYIAVLTSLLLMKITAYRNPKTNQPHLSQLTEGFRYALRSETIRTVLILVAIFSMFGFSYQVLMPVFALDHFAGNAKTMGSLMAAAALGAILGAAYLSLRSSLEGISRIMGFGALLMSTSLILFSKSSLYPLAFISLIGVGLGGVLLSASGNTLIQMTVEESKRGRISSLFTISLMGTAPIGNLMIGSTAHYLGAGMTILITGAVCLLSASLFLPRLFRKQPFIITGDAAFTLKE
jgi:MFS family permease